VSQERTFNVLVEPVDGADIKARRGRSAQDSFDPRNRDRSGIGQADEQEDQRLDGADVAFTIADGPEVASFTVIEIKAGGHFMAVMYFGSNEGMKTNAAAMASITESVQPIKK